MAKKIIPVWVSLMIRSLSKEKFNKKADCRPRSENGYCRIQYVPSPWMLGKQVALQERCAVSVWELPGNAGLRLAVVGQNWHWLKLCVGFLKTMKSLRLFKGISFFHDSGRNIMAAEGENTWVVQWSTRRSWQSSRNWLKCNSFWVNRLTTFFCQ